MDKSNSLVRHATAPEGNSKGKNERVYLLTESLSSLKQESTRVLTQTEECVCVRLKRREGAEKVFAGQ